MEPDIMFDYFWARLIIQLAKHFHIKTINIIRREEWRKELMLLGADEVINSHTEGPIDCFAAL